MQNTNFVPLPAKRIVPFIGDQSHGGPLSHNTNPACILTLSTIGEFLSSSPRSNLRSLPYRPLSESESGEQGRSVVLPRHHPWRSISPAFSPHKTSLLKHRALVRNSTEKETHLAWDLRVASTSDGHQTFAGSFPALWRNPSR
jgi:hypothetical protein